MRFKIISITVISLLLISIVPNIIFYTGMAYEADRTAITDKGEMTSPGGVKYEVTLSNKSKLTVVAENPNKETKESEFFIYIANREFLSKQIQLEAGEDWESSWEIGNDLRIVNEDHSIIVSTFGDHVEFNFTKEISSTNNTIPTPYISEVEVENGTARGEKSAVALVTVENPSIHTYSTKLMVHTQETDGSYYGASVPPGESRTITVELFDERGTEIVGEARLYTGKPSEEGGVMDQVAFSGRAGSETEVWEEEYEPIVPPWEENSYEYRNDSLEPSISERLSSSMSRMSTIAVVGCLLSIVAGWKIRG